MKINFKLLTSPYPDFSSLPYAAIFQGTHNRNRKQDIFIKANTEIMDEDNNVANALCLSDGSFQYFDDLDEIIPLPNAALILE